MYTYSLKSSNNKYIFSASGVEYLQSYSSWNTPCTAETNRGYSRDFRMENQNNVIHLQWIASKQTSSDVMTSQCLSRSLSLFLSIKHDRKIVVKIDLIIWGPFISRDLGLRLLQWISQKLWPLKYTIYGKKNLHFLNHLPANFNETWHEDA